MFEGRSQSKAEAAERAAAAQPPSLALSLTAPVEAALPPLGADELERLKPQRGLTPVGVHRYLPQSAAALSFSGGVAQTTVAGAWQATVAGRLWRLRITSPGAGGLRLHFQDFDVGAGKVWIHGADGQVAGPYGGKGMYGDGDFWSDVVFGAGATIEYQPDPAKTASPPAEAVPFRLAAVSHIQGGPGLIGYGGLPAQTAKAASSLPEKNVAACHLDVSCYSDYAEEATAVARIQYEKDGAGYVCSGALLNDRDANSQIPYFLTAAHCVDTDVVARSVIAYWRYQTQTCNGTPPSGGSVPRTNGARLLAAVDGAVSSPCSEGYVCPSYGGDAALLRLAGNPPDGSTLLGWSTGSQSVGSSVTGVHHPGGSFKRISFGSISGQYYSYHNVSWSQGLTEPGSSGSPLLEGSDGRGIVIGLLSYGSGSGDVCLTSPRDGYMKFSDFYPHIRRFLEGESGTPPPPAGLPTVSLTAQPASIQRGESATLQWSSTNAASVTIDQGIGAVEASGSRLVSPTGTTTYRIVATNADGRTAADSATVTVTAPPPSGPIAGGPLTPGQPARFRLGPVDAPTIFVGRDSYRLEVPANATRVTFSLQPNESVDMGLRVRFGENIARGQDGSWIADYVSRDRSGNNERIVITRSSDPPLRAGTYYASLVLWDTGIVAEGTLTATLEFARPLPPPVESSGLIVTIAGIGRGGYNGDGYLAVHKQLNYPLSVAADGAGNVYIADTSNHRIRKVNTATGEIVTVAGTGQWGFSGDGGPAVNARLDRPHGVALDGSGNLYIADTNNQRIRKVDASGRIATVAGNGALGFWGDGGPAVDAPLRFPFNVAADGSGNLYIADTFNNCIRKVDPAGRITTVAGTGAVGPLNGWFSGDGGPAVDAGLNTPADVAVDRAGNLYIADTWNHRIRKVDPAGRITTVAGTGGAGATGLDGGGYAGAGGPAVSARLDAAAGVAVDDAGNLYIADWNNQRIRKVDAASGTIAAIAGSGARGYGGDGGPPLRAVMNRPQAVALDGNGNLYVADSENNRIRRVILPR